MQLYTCNFTCICMCIRSCICNCVCLLHAYAGLCVYAFVYVRAYVYAYVYVYVHMYMYICIQQMSSATTRARKQQFPKPLRKLGVGKSVIPATCKTLSVFYLSTKHGNTALDALDPNHQTKTWLEVVAL